MMRMVLRIRKKIPKLSEATSVGEGAVPSEEATSNDEPPHLNLIENWFGNLRTQG